MDNLLGSIPNNLGSVGIHPTFVPCQTPAIHPFFRHYFSSVPKRNLVSNIQNQKYKNNLSPPICLMCLLPSITSSSIYTTKCNHSKNTDSTHFSNNYSTSMCASIIISQSKSLSNSKIPVQESKPVKIPISLSFSSVSVPV